MADGMVRIIVHDHTDAFVCDLDPTQVISMDYVAEVNGEHSLTIVTAQTLGKADRIIVRDAMGHWHEYVVLGIEEYHTGGGLMAHEYYCIWSLQYDMSATFVDNQFGCGVVPGHASVPKPASLAMSIALEGTGRWTAGTISVTTQASASFYRRSGWEALQTIVEKWGGELQATITVSTTGVVARQIDLLEHVGQATPTRRFDYEHDVQGLKRTVSDDIWPCRIVPLGKSEETEAGGYTRRPSIKDVNGGVMWLQDDSAVPYVRLADGQGGWEYPTAIVLNDTYEEPSDLKAWAQANITDYTRPHVTYEVEVASIDVPGLSPHGVALGDEIVVVDRSFGGDGLRITARVVKDEGSVLDPAQRRLTIGNAASSLAGQLSRLQEEIGRIGSNLADGSEYQSGTAYVSALLSRINAEANATGGYTYITEGQGIRCYDVAVSDPLVGAEASAVCEVKGGTMRIANSKDSGGNWQWKTVFTSGRILAELIDAIGASSGYHAQLTPTGMDVYDGATKVAHFGAEAVLGSTSSYNALVDSSGFAVRSELDEIVRMTGTADFSEAGDVYDGQIDVGSVGVTRIEGVRYHANPGTSVEYVLQQMYITAKSASNDLGDGDAAQIGVYSRMHNNYGTVSKFSGVALGGKTLRMVSGGTSADIPMLDAMKAVNAQSGTVGQTETVNANSYRDYNVVFDREFAAAPVVNLTIYSTTTATTSFDCDIYLRSVSTTGFTARIINRENTSRSPGFHWQAIG